MIDHVSIFSLFGVCVCVSIFILMFRIKKKCNIQSIKTIDPIRLRSMLSMSSDFPSPYFNYKFESVFVSIFVCFFVCLFHHIVRGFILPFFQLQSNSISNFCFDNLDGYESRNNEFRMK